MPKKVNVKNQGIHSIPLMLFVILSLIDIITSLMGLYSIASSFTLNILYYLMIIVFFKGVWSVYSYPTGPIGWIDVITPILVWLSFLGLNWVVTYIALALLFGKGLYCLMSFIK